MDLHLFQLYLVRVGLLAAALIACALVIIRGDDLVDPEFAALYPAVPFTLFLFTLNFGRLRLCEHGFVPGIMGLHVRLTRGFQRSVGYEEGSKGVVFVHRGRNLSLTIETRSGGRFSMCAAEST